MSEHLPSQEQKRNPRVGRATRAILGLTVAAAGLAAGDQAPHAQPNAPVVSHQVEFGKSTLHVANAPEIVRFGESSLHAEPMSAQPLQGPQVVKFGESNLRAIPSQVEFGKSTLHVVPPEGPVKFGESTLHVVPPSGPVEHK